MSCPSACRTRGGTRGCRCRAGGCGRGWTRCLWHVGEQHACKGREVNGCSAYCHQRCCGAALMPAAQGWRLACRSGAADVTAVPCAGRSFCQEESRRHVNCQNPSPAHSPPDLCRHEHGSSNSDNRRQKLIVAAMQPAGAACARQAFCAQIRRLRTVSCTVTLVTLCCTVTHGEGEPLGHSPGTVLLAVTLAQAARQALP